MNQLIIKTKRKIVRKALQGYGYLGNFLSQIFLQYKTLTVDQCLVNFITILVLMET